MPIPDIPQIEGLDIHQVLTLVYCRTYAQYCTMIERYRRGACTFCDPLDPEKNLLVKECRAWRMWMNPFPLEHTSLHLVMASRRHVAPGDPIYVDDFADMGELFKWAQDEYKFTGGGFVMRFGSPLQSSGTVLHLHANIIIPNQEGAVEVTLAKEPAKIAEQVVRMHVFERLRNGATVASLTVVELALVGERMG